MSESHWFSNICSSFSVNDLETYTAHFGLESPVEAENLKILNLYSSANWLENHRDLWMAFKSKTKRWFEDSAKEKYGILFWGSEKFPENLKSLSHPPSVLFYRGNLSVMEGPFVSVVGARSPTEIGRLWVQKIIPDLVSQGITIVSGGARGIDAEAHCAALGARGATVAFLPGSVDKPYPFGNKSIFDEIIDQGILFSEFPPDSEVRKENFHRRNRLIAGLADVVIIVEAGEKSGTFMTANKAIAENREVLVVPGPPLISSYTGSLELLSQGAGLARDAKDVIFSLARKNVLKLKGETPTLWE